MDAPMENVIFAFKSEIIKNSKDINDFTCLLQLTDENKFFSLQKTYGLQETISYIHGCLNTSKLRTEGLVLLEKLTEQCVTQVFTQNAVTWIKFIVQCLESHDPVEVKRLSCRLLATLIAASSEWLTASLKLLGVCIQSYPGPCGTFKTKLDVMVTELFKEQSVPKEAIALYVLLARVGGGGNKGIHFTEAWSNKFQQIITSLTEVVNLLYNGLNIPELESTFSVQVLPMRELPETYTNRFNILSSYHHTYCLCLQELLSQPFPAPVKIPVSDVIRLVTKVLSVNIRDLTLRPSTERLLLSGYISTLHSDAVLCLHSLISRCKTLLLPYSKTIITVMVKELMLFRTKVVYDEDDWLVQEILHDVRPHTDNMKVSYYNRVCSPSLQMRMTGAVVLTTDEDDWLVQEILHDVRPNTDNMEVSYYNRGCSPSLQTKMTGAVVLTTNEDDWLVQEIFHDVRPHTDNIKSLTTDEDDWLVQEILHDVRPHTDNMKVSYYNRGCSPSLQTRMTGAVVLTTDKDDWLVQEILHDVRPHTDNMEVSYYNRGCSPSLHTRMTGAVVLTTDKDDWLVQEILHDVRPHTDSMKTVSIKNKKDSFEPPPSKKKKKGGYSEISHGISTQKKVDLEANSELCMVALEVLYWFLTTVGCQLKQKLIEVNMF
ncbi:MNAR [Mytilus edulis]|uniref:PELP1 n=1 Tax=Mytilus edulis TaxID=6550 RepID=A0A8S3VNY5_MYTED|nr:MNAR [Mytilus edulis]